MSNLNPIEEHRKLLAQRLNAFEKGIDFGAISKDVMDDLEKALRDTSHLRLVDYIDKNGKKGKHWVHRGESDKKDMELGSKVIFQHKGHLREGTVNRVAKNGSYIIEHKGEMIDKHPHQIKVKTEGDEKKAAANALPAGMTVIDKGDEDDIKDFDNRSELEETLEQEYGKIKNHKDDDDTVYTSNGVEVGRWHDNDDNGYAEIKNKEDLGKTIGKTKSGKDVYSVSGDHKVYKDFTNDDRDDAVGLHYINSHKNKGKYLEKNLEYADSHTKNIYVSKLSDDKLKNYYKVYKNMQQSLINEGRNTDFFENLTKEVEKRLNNKEEEKLEDIFNKNGKKDIKGLQGLLNKIIQSDSEESEITVEDVKSYGFSNKDIKLMEETYENNPEIFKDGVPFEGDDKAYDKLLKKNKGAKLIQKLCNKHLD